MSNLFCFVCFFQMRTKLTKNEGIVATMFQDLKASVRRANSKDTVIQEIIPFTLPIITPTLRPVSYKLINKLSMTIRYSYDW